jgi:ppGpp synthetase/RelA/SpoT-type nucleotidyltranferase
VDEAQRANAVQRYAALQPGLRKVTEDFVRLVTALLDDAGINYVSVTGRTKSVASFAAKAARTVDGEPVYPDPVTDITDQVGVRVVTYLHADVAAVAGVLSDQLSVLDDRDMGRETARQGRFGYSSRHLLVAVDPVRGVPAAYDSLRGHSASVQVRTILQHAWAEFEHDVRYKGNVPEEHVSDLDRRFTLAAGLLELGITSLDELGGLLSSIDLPGIDARMGYRYPAGAVRRLDDALLAVFGTRYLALHGNAHREAALRARLEKIRGAS